MVLVLLVRLLQRLGYVIRRRGLAIAVQINVVAVIGSKPTDDEKSAFELLGDVNGDEVIDFADISAVEDAFGAVPGDSNWDPKCDLNGDGIINMQDLGIVTRNYGLTIKTGSPIKANVTITGPGINTTLQTPTTVTLASEGMYKLICGGQIKTINLTIYHDGDTYDCIFYFTEIPQEFPWWIVALGGAIALVLLIPAMGRG
jgi:hypothetical protein